MQIKKMELFEGKNLILLKYVQIGFMKFIFQRIFENQLCWRKINFLKLTLNVEDTMLLCNAKYDFMNTRIH